MSTKAEVVNVATASRDEERVEIVRLDAPPKEEQPLDARQEIAKKYSEKQENSLNDDEKPDLEGKKQENTPEDVDKTKSTDTIDGITSSKVPIMINGKERMVDKERVDKAGGIVAYQKEVAVMQGFKDVAEQKKLLDAREKSLLEREDKASKSELPTLDDSQAEPDKHPVKNDPPPSGDQSAVADLIKQQREAVLSGDDDLADKLMLKLISDSQRPQAAPVSLNQEEVVEQAAIKTTEIIKKNKYQQSVQDAKTDLFTAHPELKTDTRLFNAVNDETVRVEHEFPSYSPDEVLKESFKRVQSWRGKPDASDSMQAKIEEKRSFNTPNVATGRADAPPPPPKRDSNSDYVQKIKDARGQS